MSEDFELSPDLDVEVKNGKYAEVDGIAFLEQHILLTIIDVSATIDKGLKAEDLFKNFEIRMTDRLDANPRVDEVTDIIIDEDVSNNRKLKGEVIVERVEVEFERNL